MKSDLLDLTMALHAETEKAVRVSETGDDTRAAWLPKSLIEIERTSKIVRPEKIGARALPIVVITLRERVAIEKGFA